MCERYNTYQALCNTYSSRDVQFCNMKNIIPITIISLVLIALSTTQSFASKDPLQFMVKGNFNTAISFAKQERKPMLVYIHSNKCISSRTFIRQVIAKQGFAQWADKNFVCLDANITTIDGNNIAKKYNVTSLPTIILVSYDQDLEYTVEMKLDSVSLYNQFRSFVTANNLKSQIEMLHSTNGLSYKDASIAIAQSYAKRDFKKYPTAPAEMLAFERTLNISKLGYLHQAYVATYNKLASGVTQ